MYPRTILIAVAVSMLIPRLVSGQEVDPSVQAIDPSVNFRVQDPDFPDIALLPGGSSAWTGQPIMSQTPTTGATGSPQKAGSASRASQFPSLVGISTWGQSSFGSSSSPNASGAQDSLNLTGARARPQGASRWSKNTFSWKANVMTAAPTHNQPDRAAPRMSSRWKRIGRQVQTSNCVG